VIFIDSSGGDFSVLGYCHQNWLAAAHPSAFDFHKRGPLKTKDGAIRFRWSPLRSIVWCEKDPELQPYRLETEEVT
jgi:hypothetical protein